LLLFAIMFLSSVEDARRLYKTDLLLLVLLPTCIACGFLVIIPQPLYLAYFWLVLAFMTYIPFLGLQKFLQSNKDLHKRPNQSKLVLWFTVAMPTFPIVYLLALFKVINEPMTIVLMQFLSMATKGVFASIMVDVHMEGVEIAMTNALQDEKSANENRRAYLKYLFHEVRSPLNSLTMGIQILQGCRIEEDYGRESLVMMGDASEFMAATLNDVLSIQKMEEGKLELQYLPFDISECVSKVFSTYRGALVAKHIHLTHSIGREVPKQLCGDRFRIEHVIANLLSNAVKFSPPRGTVAVTVSVSATPPQSTKAQTQTQIQAQAMTEVGEGGEGEGGEGEGEGAERGWISHVTVAVRDQGPGISAANQAKLFQSFSQINAAELQQGGGSGLGLSLCKEIVQMHGGSIGVTSEEGHGATFHFTIPFQVLSDPSQLYQSTQRHFLYRSLTGSNHSTLRSPQELSAAQLQLHQSTSQEPLASIPSSIPSSPISTSIPAGGGGGGGDGSWLRVLVVDGTVYSA
jgi:signal transduction histidine kinase